MTTHYRVFLPPQDIAPFPLRGKYADHLPLHLLDLPSRDGGGWSASLPRREAEILARTARTARTAQTARIGGGDPGPSRASSLAGSDSERGIPSRRRIWDGGNSEAVDTGPSKRRRRRRTSGEDVDDHVYAESVPLSLEADFGDQTRSMDWRLMEVELERSVNPSGRAAQEGTGTKGKRRAAGEVEKGEAEVEVESSQSQFQSQERDKSRRRSNRLGRTSASLLGTLPGPSLLDSFLSLNTTVSLPTQLDPAGDHAHALPHARLPVWTLPLSKLVPLPALLSRGSRKGMTGWRETVSVVVCVMAVETSVLRRRKEERARGVEGTLWVGGWRVTAMPDGPGDRGALGGAAEVAETVGTVGTVKGTGEVGCEVKLWGECARDWGDERVRRGDVVLLENVEFKPATSKDPAQIILSPTPTLVPRPTILYRTLPRYVPARSHRADPNPYKLAAPDAREMVPEDRALRPDLRLARSDAGVRRVAEVARWFAEWIGGEVPPMM